DSEPNYDRVRLSSQWYPLHLASGDEPESYFAYASSWGLLADRDAYVPLMSQPQMHDFLRRHHAVLAELPGQDASEMVARLATEQAVSSLPGTFHRSGLAQPSRLTVESGSPDSWFR